MTRDDEDEVDSVFELLANRRRRVVIEVLRASPRGTLEVPTLVDAVATTGDVASDGVASSLYHRDLPKLAAAGVISYDEENDVVEYDTNPLVERCLDVAESYRSEEWVHRSTNRS